MPMTKGEAVHIIVNTILKDLNSDKTAKTPNITRGETMQETVEKLISTLQSDDTTESISDIRKSVIASILVGESPQELPSELYDSLTKAISLDLINSTDGFNCAITANELFELIITANQLANPVSEPISESLPVEDLTDELPVVPIEEKPQDEFKPVETEKPKPVEPTPPKVESKPTEPPVVSEKPSGGGFDPTTIPGYEAPPELQD